MNKTFASILGVTILLFSTLMCGRVEGYPPRTFYSSKATKDSVERPRVLFALKVWEHWALVPGGAPPIFTLYEDRSIIYFDNQEGVYKHVILSEDEFIQISKMLLNRRILTLEKYYSTSGWTCQNMYHFFFRISDLQYPITVYGHPTKMEEGATLPPKEIREIFTLVSNYEHEDATKWLPAKIEVFFWPYDHAPAESVAWPDSWPDLDDPTTVRKGELSYSVFLDSKYLDELKGFIKTRKPKGAVLINGQKMSIYYRFPIPGENFPVMQESREERLKALVYGMPTGAAVSIKKEYITRSESKRRTIDELTLRPLYLIQVKRYECLGTATGFVVAHGKENYLITNWHVVSGKYPTEEKILNEEGKIPESLLIVHHGKQIGSWVVKSEPLYDDMGKKRWLEHSRGRYVNIVALPLEAVTDDVQLYPFDVSLADTDMMPEVAMRVSIIGFPGDLTSPGSFPIWKTAHIASEPYLDFLGKPFFLIDGAAGGGMSGAPVILRLSGGYKTKDGSRITGSVEYRTLFLGVYSGLGVPESEIGRVWRPGLIREILRDK
jgi:hypothetical protein